MHKSTAPSPLCWALLATGTLVQAAPASLLPLTPGTYVVSSYTPCENAPLAGVRAFDGKAFVGPHDSACTSSIVSHRGQAYRLSTECRAHGDGTPETPTKTVEDVQVRSSSSFVVTVHARPVQYDLCPAFR